MIGFQEDNHIKVTPLVDVNFTNAICFGQTGSGKTTSFILPNIKNRIEQGHGILIYDFKGNLHLHIKKIVDDLDSSVKIHEIGKPWGRKIDILDGITSRGIEALFEASGSTHNDTYWTNSARDLFENIYKLCKNISITLEKLEPIKTIDRKKYIPTITNIYSFIRSSSSLVKFFMSVRELKLTIEKVIINHLKANRNTKNLQEAKEVNIMLNYLEDINKYYDLLSEFHEMKSAGETSGKNGVLNVLNTTLVNIAENDHFSEKDLDIVKSLDAGEVVIINVQDMNTSILNMLNTTIYQKLNVRTSINSKKPITIFIDEAQKVLSPNYIPDVDICRENMFEYIFSTQDQSLLENKLGENRVYELLRNIIEQYTFKTNDQDNRSSKLRKFEYLNLTNNSRKYAEPLFYEENDLFKVEHDYLLEIDAFKLVDIQNDKDFIIKYNHSLLTHKQVIAQYRDGEERIVNLISFKDLLSDYIIRINTLQKNDELMEDLANELRQDQDSTDTLLPPIDKIIKNIKDLDKYKLAVSTAIGHIKRLDQKVQKMEKNLEEVSFKVSI